MSFSRHLVPLLVLAGAPLADAQDWPGWRGPARDAISPDRGLLPSWPSSGPPLLYQAKGLGGGFSSLAVAGGRLFTLGDLGGEQRLLVLDAKDGKLLWSAPVGAPFDDGRGGPRSTPAVGGDLVFALGSHGDLVAVEAATGKPAWRRHLERDFGGQMMSMWKWSESPLVDGERVIVTPGVSGAGLVALDRRTGKEVWRAALPSIGPAGKDGAAYSSVVISQGAGVKQYVQLLGRGLVGVRADDGKLLWSYNRIANDVANIPTPLVSGDHVFTSTGYQTGAALLKLERSGAGVSAREVYFLDPKTFQNHHGGMVLAGGFVYAGHGHNRGFPICLELHSGQVKWGGDQRNAGSGSAAVTYADGRMLMRYENGLMLLVEASPAGYKELGSFQIPDVSAPSWSHPVVVGGRLYLREQDRLYVYDLKPRK